MRALALLLAGLLGAATANRRPTPIPQPTQKAPMSPPNVELRVPDVLKPKQTFDVMVRLSNPSGQIIYNAGLIVSGGRVYVCVHECTWARRAARSRD